MQSKKIKRIIAAALIIIAGITGFYEYRYRSLKEDSKEMIVVAVKDIYKNTILTEDNIKLESRSVNDILKTNVKDIKSVIGTVATETIYENEDVVLERVMEKEEYEKINYKLISIPVNDKDTLVGYSARVNDRVDLLYYDNKGVYEGQPYLEGINIYALTTQSGDYIEFNSSEKTASYVLFWVKSDKAEDINAKLEQKGYFKLQINKDRN